MKTEMQPIRLEEYRTPDFAIEKVDLDFILDPAATLVTATLAIRPLADTPVPLTLDGDDIKLVGVTLDGEALARKVEDRRTWARDELGKGAFVRADGTRAPDDLARQIVQALAKPS